jgi:hypothetical protein
MDENNRNLKFKDFPILQEFSIMLSAIKIEI